MDIKKSEIQKMAEEYAEEQNSAYTNDYYGFIAGFEKALSLFAVSGRSEQLVCDCDNPQKNDRGFNWCCNCNRMLQRQ